MWPKLGSLPVLSIEQGVETWIKKANYSLLTTRGCPPDSFPAPPTYPQGLPSPLPDQKLSFWLWAVPISKSMLPLPLISPGDLIHWRKHPVFQSLTAALSLYTLLSSPLLPSPDANCLDLLKPGVQAPSSSCQFTLLELNSPAKIAFRT